MQNLLELVAINLQQHGGSLTLEASLRRGTTFLVRLPLGRDRSAAPAAGRGG